MLKKCQMLPVAGMPEHIGKAVVFVTSDATAEFMTGSDVVVDGGCLLNPFHILGVLGVQQ